MGKIFIWIQSIGSLMVLRVSTIYRKGKVELKDEAALKFI